MSTGQPDNKGLEHLRRIASRALDEDDYRQRLLSDPVGVLKQEGITVQAGVNVVVHQNTEQEVHLVLPTGFQEAHQLNADETDISVLGRTCVHV
jgi:hypothetical protein